MARTRNCCGFPPIVLLLLNFHETAGVPIFPASALPRAWDSSEVPVTVEVALTPPAFVTNVSVISDWWMKRPKDLEVRLIGAGSSGSLDTLVVKRSEYPRSLNICGWNGTLRCKYPEMPESMHTVEISSSSLVSFVQVSVLTPLNSAGSPNDKVYIKDVLVGSTRAQLPQTIWESTTLAPLGEVVPVHNLPRVWDSREVPVTVEVALNPPALVTNVSVLSDWWMKRPKDLEVRLIGAGSSGSLDTLVMKRSEYPRSLNICGWNGTRRCKYPDVPESMHTVEISSSSLVSFVQVSVLTPLNSAGSPNDKVIIKDVLVGSTRAQFSASIMAGTTLPPVRSNSPIFSNDCAQSAEKVSRSWRVVASTTRSGWAWDVTRLNFLTDHGIIQLGGDDCSIIQSGSVSDQKHGGIPGYEPENAFSNNTAWWGGRVGENTNFYLGITCVMPKLVKAVQILQKGKHIADAAIVQRSDGGEWTTVQEVRFYKESELETISLSCDYGIVKGLLRLSLIATEATAAPWDVHVLMHESRAFLAASIAKLYDLGSVVILCIDADRRLTSTRNVRFRIKFSGLGRVVAEPEPTMLPGALQELLHSKFGPYGWEVQGVDVDFEVEDGEFTTGGATKVNAKLYVLVSMLVLVALGTCMLAVLCILRRRAKGKNANRVEAVPVNTISSLSNFESNETKTKDAYAAEKVDSATWSAALSSVSTRTPPLDDLCSLEDCDGI